MKKIDFNQDWSYRYNDGEKIPVMLPHDAMLHSPRSANSPGTNANGFFEGGVYTYEKEWFVPADWKDKSVMLEFGGIYKNAKIYLNDAMIAEQPYGYTTFAVCLDSGLICDAQNRIKVVADNSKLPNSRWYSGGGIYRPVWLYTGDAARVEYNGVKITTLSVSPAVIQVETKATADVKIDILDGDTVVASAYGEDVQITLKNAKLWSAETPHLYTCRVTAGEDVVNEPFGVRHIQWSTRGLFINGQETLLKGACIHHDHGILGACGYADAEERRIRKLKEFGFNAVRMAHHPAGKELLDACDKLGMYVMDEAFDMWYEHKNPYDYASDYEVWHMKDLQAMVDKDYNHPSVIMYSIGNEVSEPREEKGMAEARAMQDYLHKVDPTRPVTAGINLMILYLTSKGKGVFNGSEDEKKEEKPAKKAEDEKPSPVGSLFFNLMMQKMGAGMNNLTRIKPIDEVTTPILDALDIAGYNYASGRYSMEQKKHPIRIIVGSETFPQDIAKNWKMVEKYPNIIGDFMWTGWDYLGEAAIGAWNYEGVNMGNVPYPWLLADVCAAEAQ